MAVLFGFQLILTGICAMILQKIFPLLSPGLKLLTNYRRFVVPSQSEMKKQAMNAKTSKDLRIDNKTVLELSQLKNTGLNDVTFLPFFTDVEWIINFGIMTAIFHTTIQGYFELGFNADAKVHMGVLWCLIEIILLLSVLWRLVKTYAKSASGDLSVILTLASLSMVTSMICLLDRGRFLDVGVEDAYKNFESNSESFFKSLNFNYRAPNQVLFFLSLAIVTTVLSAILTFPGIKAAQVFSLTFQHNPVTACINYSLPFVVCLLWLDPIKKLIMYPKFSQLEAFEGARMGDSELGREPTVTAEMYDKTRIAVVLFLCIFKLATFRTFFQCYLDSPAEELSQLRKEAGYTHATKIQEEIRKVNLASCITAIQYLAPPLFILMTTFMLQALSGEETHFLPKGQANDGSIVGKLLQIEQLTSQNGAKSAYERVQDMLGGMKGGWNEDDLANFGKVYEVFGQTFWKGVLGYILWYSSLFLSISSLLGLGYFYKKHNDPESKDARKYKIKSE